MAKSKKGIGGRILKWIGIITAVISLVLGAREIVSMIREGIAQKTKAAELKAEAERLSSAGDYSQAWQSISQAVELQPDYRVTQVAVAMAWLRDIRIAPNRGERTFTEIAEKLLPVLHGAIDTSRKSYSTAILAHIGWANFLMFKEGDRSVKVDEAFKHALILDSTNLYAHAMYGFWILYPGHGVEFFATKNDPAQISVTEEVMKRLREIHPASLAEHDDGNGPVAWVLLIPSTSDLMNRFIAKQMTEKELLEQTPVPGKTFSVIARSAS